MKGTVPVGDRSRGEGPGRWTGFLPSGFVVLALLAVLLAPLVMQREIRRRSEEIQTRADPARTAVTRVQYLLARQTSALRGYLISGDRSYLRQFDEFTREELEEYESLERLTRELGREPLSRYVELRTRSAAWHAELRDELPRIVASPGAPQEIPFERQDYLQTLEAATRLDQALVAATVERQASIRQAEDRMVLVVVLLSLVALGAAVVTARLGARVHRLAGEAEARRGEAELALAETSRAIDAKARLIRGVTHDVKNPLGAADGYAELLEMGLRGPVTREQAEVVAGIRRSIRSALDIIGDLLELSQAESGSLGVERELTGMTALVRETAAEYQGAAQASGHELTVRVPDGATEVYTDPARVRQILGNLLSNALKYTPRGSRIVLEVEPSDAGPHRGSWIVVHVHDDGPGIASEHQERVFGEFERVAGSGREGHGLGLAISRRIAHLLGGDLTLRSEPGRGCTFSLWLPVRVSESDPATPSG